MNGVSVEKALDLHRMTALILYGRINGKIGQILIDLILPTRRMRYDHPILIAVKGYFDS